MTSPIRLFLVSLVLTHSVLSLASGATSGEKTKTLQRISFRTKKPTIAHLHSEKEIKETTALLTEIGCEIKTTQHDGHVDLRYECSLWKTITLQTAAEAKQWDAWLTGKGFFVVHNTPGKDHKETVQYRLDDWKTFHFKNKTETESYLAIFKMLGCETKLQQHGDHQDVRARCAGWRSLGVPSHAEASAWMGVLRKLGFAVDHHH